MRNSPITVSVVIPTYDVEEYVRDAVESALNQTYPLQEIICVDDGSTDSTLDVLRALESQHPEQLQVLTGPNRGACAARNRGMSVATGEYIQFLDADDVLLPEKVERDVAVLGEDRESLLFGGFVGFKDKTEIKTYECNTYVSENPWVCLARQNFGHTSSNLFRTDAVERAGGWDECRPFNQEYDLIARMLMEGADVAFAHHKSTHTRNREDSISAEFGREMRIARAELDRDILTHVRDIDTDMDSIAAIEEAAFRRLRQLYRVDPETAVRLHRETFPNGYVPVAGGTNTTEYCIAYRMLGFSGAECLKTAVEKIRSWDTSISGDR